MVAHRMLIACLLLVELSACRRRRSGTEGNPSTNPGSNPGAVQGTPGTPAGPGISGQNQGQSSVQSVPPTPATGCPAQQLNSALGPGTVHNEQITTNETWTLEGSPHRFPDGAVIHENVTVTVAPCATVLIGDGRRMVVDNGGAIIAVGDAQHPIRFGSNKNEPQPGDWEAIVYEERARASSRLAFVTVEHGGKSSSSSELGCIRSRLVGTDLQHVLTRNCAGFGVAFWDQGTFSSTSVDLTVRDTAVAGNSHAGAVFFQNANSVRTLPQGAYGGNEVNEIYIENNQAVTESGTWRNPGIRYRIADDVDLRVEGPRSPVLQIAPGTTIAFGSNSSLAVGMDAEGALVAEGTEQERITFTASATEPNAGAWEGLFVGERALRARTKFAWVNIAFAGGDSGYDSACAWNENENDGALYVAAPLPAENISHVTFGGLPENAAAIVRTFQGTAIDYGAAALANNFGAGTSCKQSPLRGADGCPENARCN